MISPSHSHTSRLTYGVLIQCTTYIKQGVGDKQASEKYEGDYET
jgi:hypothetical protein